MIYIALFMASFILTYLVRNYAIKKSLVAQVTNRSSHTVATPYGGGIAIAVSWFIGLNYLFYIDKIQSPIYYALLMGIILCTISYLDDLFELSVKLRIVIQALVAILGIYFLGGLRSVDLGFISVNDVMVVNVFAFFLIVWFINLYNFLDGIDGYAGSEAVFLGLAGFVFFHEDFYLVLVFSVLGFLVWNWDKAKIFMGDVGSTLLGYNIAIFTLYSANQEPTNFWIWIVLFGVFWFDATITLLRRFKNKEKLSQAHKKHAYQRLTQSGFSHAKTVIYSLALNILLFLFVFFISNVFIAFLFSIIVLYISVRLVDNKKGFS